MNVIENPIGVLGAGFTLAEDNVVYPTIALDVTDRPDVADLARVHAHEGVGDIATAAAAVDGGVLLAVGLTSPVRAAFVIGVSDREHLAVLRAAAEEGHLLLATTVPQPDAGESAAARSYVPAADTTWLAIDLEPESTTAVLDEAMS